MNIFCPISVDLSANKSNKKLSNADVYGEQNTFSDLFFTIAEQVAGQTNWILDENFTEILNLINNENDRQIITIDNVFMVFAFAFNLFFFKLKIVIIQAKS